MSKYNTFYNNVINITMWQCYMNSSRNPKNNKLKKIKQLFMISQ